VRVGGDRGVLASMMTGGVWFEKRGYFHLDLQWCRTVTALTGDFFYQFWLSA
jgi:hypothetical protein